LGLGEDEVKVQREFSLTSGLQSRGREESLHLKRLQSELVAAVEQMTPHGDCILELMGQDSHALSAAELKTILIEGGTLRLSIRPPLVAILVASIHEARDAYQRGTSSLEQSGAAISEQIGYLTSLLRHAQAIPGEYAVNDVDDGQSNARQIAIERFEMMFDDLILHSPDPCKSISEWLIGAACHLVDTVMPHSLAVEHLQASQRLIDLLNEMLACEFIHPQREFGSDVWDHQRDPRLATNRAITSSIEFSVIPDGDAYWIDRQRNAIMDWIDGHSNLAQLIEGLHGYASMMRSTSECWYRRHHHDLAQMKAKCTENDLYLTRDQMIDLQMHERLGKISATLDRRWRALHKVTTRWWWRGSAAEVIE
jgi:hypothetical protein